MSDTQVTGNCCYFVQKYGYGKIAKNLGNTSPIDGYLYYGRGPIQLTGKANVAAASHALFNDNRLVNSPGLLQDKTNNPSVGIRASAWFWQSKGLKGVMPKSVHAALRLDCFLVDVCVTSSSFSSSAFNWARHSGGVQRQSVRRSLAIAARVRSTISSHRPDTTAARS